jgi:hypothetical protein
MDDRPPSGPPPSTPDPNAAPEAGPAPQPASAPTPAQARVAAARQAARRSAPPREARRSGCGCPAGCLIALGVVVALVLGGAAAGYVWGRPYIARQLPAWEARFPLLGPALDLTGLRARLVPPTDTEHLQRTRQEGENDRSLLPADVAVYPTAVAEAYSVSLDQVTAYQRVAEPVEVVREHLATSMAASGWALSAERETEVGTLLGWTKEQRTCQVELIPDGRYTEVWLRGSGK